MSRRMSRMRVGGRSHHKKRVKTVRRKRRSLRRNTMKCPCPKTYKCCAMNNRTKRRRRRRSKRRKQKGG